MSNDTTVHLLISSSDQLELSCVLAYIRNKDKSAELEYEEVRYNSSRGYFFRVSGFANENGSFYPITGEGGDIYDLLSRFSGLEIEGCYSDEHSTGELEYGYEKWGGDKKEENPMFCLHITFPSLYKSSGWNGHTLSSLGDFVFEEFIPFNYDSGSSSYPQSLTDSIILDYSCEADEADKEELWKETIKYLQKLKAPRDTLLSEECYYQGTRLREEKLWGNESKDSTNVSKYEVDKFLNSLDTERELNPKDLLNNPEELILNDLEFSDEEGNNVMHLAAKVGKLKGFTPEFLTTENILIKNNNGFSVRELAIKYGFADQLPELLRMENFEVLHNQALTLQNLKENGNLDVVQKILDNFPNPLFE